MSFLKDAKVLWHMAVSPIKGDSHQQRLESFYAGQAEAYDDFRKRLLHGREDLYASLDMPEGGVWIDLGGGTGSNLECVGDRMAALKQAYLVDLTPSLVEVARKRVAARGWKNVTVVEGDATAWRPEEGLADVVTFSYSLTMIPDWFKAIDHALSLLKPGGRIGVVDFYIARKYPPDGRATHNWFTRTFWPSWFVNDNVYLTTEHLPYLEHRFELERLEERRATVPYMPLVRVPYYIFVGKKRG